MPTYIYFNTAKHPGRTQNLKRPCGDYRFRLCRTLTTFTLLLLLSLASYGPAFAQREVIFEPALFDRNFGQLMSVHEDRMIKVDVDADGVNRNLNPDIPFVTFYEFIDGDWRLTSRVELDILETTVQDVDIYGDLAVMSCRSIFRQTYRLLLFSRDSNGQWQITDELSRLSYDRNGSTNLFYFNDVEVNSTSVAYGNIDIAYKSSNPYNPLDVGDNDILDEVFLLGVQNGKINESDVIFYKQGFEFGLNAGFLGGQLDLTDKYFAWLEDFIGPGSQSLLLRYFSLNSPESINTINAFANFSQLNGYVKILDMNGTAMHGKKISIAGDYVAVSGFAYQEKNDFIELEKVNIFDLTKNRDNAFVESLENSTGLLADRFGDALDFRYDAELGKYFLAVGASGFTGLTAENKGTIEVFEQNDRAQWGMKRIATLQTDTNLALGQEIHLAKSGVLARSLIPSGEISNFGYVTGQRYHFFYFTPPPIELSDYRLDDDGFNFSWKETTDSSVGGIGGVTTDDYEYEYLVFDQDDNILQSSTETNFTDDSNIPPGTFKSYKIFSQNGFGQSPPAYASGYKPQEGEIKGTVTIPSDNSASGGAGTGVGGTRLWLKPPQSEQTFLTFPATPSDNNYVTTSINEFPDEFTVEFWIRPGNITGSKYILSHATPGNSKALLIGINEGKLRVGLNNQFEDYSSVSTDEWQHFAISFKDSELKVYKNGQAEGETSISEALDIADNGIIVLGQVQDCPGGCFDVDQAYQGDLDELRIWGVARTAEDISGLYNAVPAVPVGTTTGTGAAYEDLLLNYRFDENYPQNKANRVLYDYSSTLNSATGTSTSTSPSTNPGFIKGAVSFNTENVEGRLNRQAISLENSGNYAIPDILPDGRQFVVEPDKTGGRIFEPESINLTLSNNEKIRDEVNFVDKSIYEIAGRVYFEYKGVQIAAPDVEVVVKSTVQEGQLVTVETFKTDAKGVYSGTLESGNYVLEPVYADHTFSRRTQDITLPADVGDSIFFVNTTTRTLSGKFVGGSCDLNVGGADFEIIFKGFEKTLSTSVEGGIHRFNLSDIPALINDSVAVNITALDNNQLVLEKLVQGEGSFLDASQFAFVDSADAEVNFFYRAPTTLEIFQSPNMQPIECIGENVYLLSEGNRVTLTLSAFELYNGERCDIDTATVRIFDAISDRPDSTTYLRSTDTRDLTYTLRAGNPNVIGGGPRPYQKSLQIDFDVPGGQTVSKTIYAIVQGSTPRIGQPFISTSPSNIPLFILRDPPGDKSFSYIEQGQKITRNISLKDGTSKDNRVITTVGDKRDFPIWAEGELGLGFSGGGEKSFALTMTTRERISTSTEDGVLPGKMSDVFVGTNVNILYGLTDILTYNPEICEATLSQEITWFPQRVSSNYFTSYGQIVNGTIPELESLIALETDPVRIDSLNAAITDWKRLKDYNDYLSQYTVSEGAVQIEEFDAGSGALARSSTITKSETDAYYFTTTFNARLEIGWNATIPIPFIGIVSPAGGFFSTKIGYQFTESGSTTTEETYEVGYTLDDNDIGDNFLVEVTSNLVDDPKFESEQMEFSTLAADLDNTLLTNATPSFRLIGGQSSAPWEGLPSVPRDSSQILVSPHRQANVGAEEEAVFTLNVGNLSQSGEPRDYEVRVLPASNPDGLIISSGSGNLTTAKGIFLEDVPANESVTITFTTKKGPNAYNYEDIAIVALSPYEYAATAGNQRLSDTTYFSVSYDAPCEPVAVFRPEDGWIVNNSSNDSLRVIVDEYDKSTIQEVSLQLKSLPTGNWRTFRTLTSDELDDGYTALYVEVSSLADGSYDFRAVTQCQGGQVYSDVFTGFIDRSAPVSLEIFPEFGELSPEDVIALNFNEDIDPATINTNNLVLTNATTGDTLEVSFRNNERRIIIDFDASDPALENQLLQASARGIADQYGNVIAPFKWEFVVNNSPIRWELPRIIEYMQAGENLPLTPVSRTMATKPSPLNWLSCPAGWK